MPLTAEAQQRLDAPMMTKKHINDLKAGDIILCRDGKHRTLCPKYIGGESFFGRAIFGDNYKSGHELVDVITNFGKYRIENGE